MLKTLTRTGIAAAACAAATLLAPGAASAQAYSYQGYPQNYGTGAYGQPYDYNQGSYYSRDSRSGYYDACERRRDNQVAGGVVGATIGAIAGSQIAARGHRTDGSILGGVLGAAVGASAGRNSNGAAACDSRYDRSGYDYRYGDNRDRGYDDRYRDDRDDRGYDDRNRSSYDSSGYRTDGDGCRVAESQVRLPDGRYETRYVRACPDQYGRYRVVD